MFGERGYDVVVACNLAKVDVPVQFRLPAPNFMGMYWLRFSSTLVLGT